MEPAGRGNAGDIEDAAVRLVSISAERLKLAGHDVAPADSVPGLWNIGGLARDVTTEQLHQLADEYGMIFPLPFRGKIINLDAGS